MQTRILDRSNYESRTIATFELVAAYFTDIFYNHLYDQAKNIKTAGNAPSVTHGYKHALQAWIQGLDKTYFHSKTIKGIHDWMLNYTKFTTISYNACIDKIVSEFIPSDYYNSLTNNQKTGVLKKIINNANRAIIQKIVNEFLGIIIDNRNPDNAIIIKDAMVDILIWEKETMYQKFVESQTAPRGGNMDHSMRYKVEAEIKQLIKEKYELKVLVENLKKIIIKNNKTIETLTETIGELQSSLSEATSAVSMPLPMPSYNTNHTSPHRQEPQKDQGFLTHVPTDPNPASHPSSDPSLNPPTNPPANLETQEPVKSTKPTKKRATTTRKKTSASTKKEKEKEKDQPADITVEVKSDPSPSEYVSEPVIDMGKYIDIDLYK